MSASCVQVPVGEGFPRYESFVQRRQEVFVHHVDRRGTILFVLEVVLITPDDVVEISLEIVSQRLPRAVIFFNDEETAPLLCLLFRSPMRSRTGRGGRRKGGSRVRAAGLVALISFASCGGRRVDEASGRRLLLRSRKEPVLPVSVRDHARRTRGFRVSFRPSALLQKHAAWIAIDNVLSVDS